VLLGIGDEFLVSKLSKVSFLHVDIVHILVGNVDYLAILLKNQLRSLDMA